MRGRIDFDQLFASYITDRMSMPPPHRNLIISAVARYGREALTPFVESWRQNVRSADLVLIVDQMNPETVAWLREHGVGVVPASFCLARGEAGWRKAVRTSALRVACDAFIGWIKLCGGDWSGRADRIRDAMLDVMSSRFADFARYLSL